MTAADFYYVAVGVTMVIGQVMTIVLALRNGRKADDVHQEVRLINGSAGSTLGTLASDAEERRQAAGGAPTE
jgi:hypothetical protein